MQHINILLTFPFQLSHRILVFNAINEYYNDIIVLPLI